MSAPTDYVAARQRFRDVTERLGWIRHPYPIATSSHGDLTIDVAMSSATSADAVLVVSSGLHGVEGAFGSAVQAEYLERWARAPGVPAGVRCVFLHALNPYGFANSRRADADNVDLNRNFLGGNAPYVGSTYAYRRFDPLLNPRSPPSASDLFYVQMLWHIAVYGRPALKQALITGQYDFPKGLFFGGSAPSPTLTILRQHMKTWIGDARTVAHLDFHVGLGSWGSHKLIADVALDEAQRTTLARWFGDDSFEQHDPRGVAYRAKGSFGQWCVGQNFAPNYLFAFAEFGTYGNLSVLSGLRAENRAHHWGRPDDPATMRAKRRLRDLFYPESDAWRSRTLADGIALIDRAARGLSGTRLT
jgi:hypothetical protein